MFHSPEYSKREGKNGNKAIYSFTKQQDSRLTMKGNVPTPEKPLNYSPKRGKGPGSNACCLQFTVQK